MLAMGILPCHDPCLQEVALPTKMRKAMKPMVARMMEVIIGVVLV